MVSVDRLNWALWFWSWRRRINVSLKYERPISLIRTKSDLGRVRLGGWKCVSSIWCDWWMLDRTNIWSCFFFFLNLCSETKAKPRFLLISGEQFCFRVLGKHLKLNVGQLVRFYSSRQAYEADQNWTELNVGSWKKEKGT